MCRFSFFLLLLLFFCRKYIFYCKTITNITIQKFNILLTMLYCAPTINITYDGALMYDEDTNT